MNILPEFKSLIPPLSDSEYYLLEESIKLEGCRDPIVCWNDAIVDGHNRFEICARHDIPFTTSQLDFASDNEAKEWMINNQFGRRNLPLFVRAELALKLKPILEVKGKENMAAGGSEGLLNSAKVDVRKELAEKAGVGTDTIAKTEKILGKADEETIAAVRSGEISINEASKKANGAHVSRNSGNNEWYTPPEFTEAARQVMGGIDLDPASSDKANETVLAAAYYTSDDCGLSKPWTGRIWMNPPYGQPLISQFSERISQAFDSGEISEAIVLVNNATETAWFQRMMYFASAICFVKGRIKYLDSTGVPANTPLQGQALLYMGKNDSDFANVFQQFGFVVTRL